MNIIVQKYGSTSLDSEDKIKGIAEHIIKRKAFGCGIVAVVSAMGNITGNLMEMAYNLSPYPDKHGLEALMAAGEQVSMSLLAIALRKLGAGVVSLSAAQLGIDSKKPYIESIMSDVNECIIREQLDLDNIIIVAGFQGADEYNEIAVPGREGSDTTAVALAARLQAQCEIYTDVDGIYTVDPRLYPRARKLDYISYEEMLEMASSGAVVLHPASIELAERYKVPVTVALHTGDIPGTVIKEMDSEMENSAITGLAVNNEEAMVTLNGVPHDIRVIAEIFQGIANEKINIDMISQTFPVNNLVNISFTLPKYDLPQAAEILDRFKKRIHTFDYEAYQDISKLSVVGLGMNSQPGVAARVFKLLAENDIPVSIVTTSEIKISYIINPEDQQKAIEAIAMEFNL